MNQRVRGACPLERRLHEGTVTRAEAVQILGVSPKRVTDMRWQGQFQPVTTPRRKIGMFDRGQVEALAAVREERCLEAEQRRALQAGNLAARSAG